MMLSVLFLAVSAQTTGYVDGASMRLYYIGSNMSEVAELVPGQTPNVDQLIPAIDLRSFGEFKDQFRVEITGDINIPADGEYKFRLSCDDGAIAYIDGKQVVAFDGIHPANPGKEASVTLKAGWHPLRVSYFEQAGEEQLTLEWQRPGDTAYAVVGGTSLRSPAGLTRVISPGPKRIMGVAGALRPGNGMPLDRVNPAWRVVDFRPADFRPQVGAMAFRPDGGLLITTFHPNQNGGFQPNLRDGKMFLVTGLKPGQTQVKEVATDLQDPLGMCFMDGQLYVAQRREITRMEDRDNDGYYETKTTVASGWTADNYHHFNFGLYPKDGYLYGALSVTIGPARGINGPNPRYRGSAYRVLPNAYDPQRPFKNIEFFTSGHRTPNGIGPGPDGTIIVGENQGAWQPSNKINVLQPGAFYGHYNDTEWLKDERYPTGGFPGAFQDKPFTLPAIYIPQNEGGNSPAQPVMIPSGPFQGQLFVTDVKYGGLSRAFFDHVAGQYQGGFVHSSQGFESGTHRLLWGPDGDLYMGGMGASETWGWTDPKTGKETTFGLQKLEPTGQLAFEIRDVHVTRDGFTVRFTKPVAPSAKLAEKVAVRQWDYQPTPDYGGDKFDKESLNVTRVQRSADGMTLDLTIPGLKEGRVVYLNFDVESTGKEPMWSPEVWYTLNLKPRVMPKPKPMNVLLFTKTAGFRHDSIPAAIKMFTELGQEHGFRVEATEDSGQFTDSNLKRFDAVVFANTTGDILNPEQQAAFERFIKSGKGYLGIHAASDTEYSWPWYGELVGAYFKSHPPGVYEAEVHLEAKDNPTVKMLPSIWRRVDEWYDFRTNPRGKVNVLASLDEKSYSHEGMGDDHPVIWSHEFGGGRAWYTALGHTPETYGELLFRASIYNALRWVTRTE